MGIMNECEEVKAIYIIILPFCSPPKNVEGARGQAFDCSVDFATDYCINSKS